MITWNDILIRIKEELSFPNQALEREDTEIVDYCKRNCIRKFSKYFPDTHTLSVTTSDPNIPVPGVSGQYYLLEPDGREILDVVEFIPSLGDYVIMGHPYIGSFNWGHEVEEQALETYRANNLKAFSSYYNYTIKFKPPNVLRVAPQYKGMFTIEYERVHSDQLETLTPDLEDDFIELCISMTFMNIGRLRRRYQGIQTPFGEINLNADEIFNEGQERYNAVIEKFNNGSIPQVIFDRG